MTAIRFASWNVNSLKVRLPHLLQWLKTCDDRLEPIDHIGLQELKMTDEKFPIEDLEKTGFLSLFMGQKTYNGVAILVRKSALTHLNQDQDTAFLNIQLNLPDFIDDQKRLLASTLHFKETAPIRVICAYFPNGQAPGTEKFLYKLQWLSALKVFLVSELQKYPRLILMGDFNIAPLPIDVHDPALWEGKVLFSEKERAALHDIASLGFVDSFRFIIMPFDGFIRSTQSTTNTVTSFFDTRRFFTQ